MLSKEVIFVFFLAFFLDLFIVLANIFLMYSIGVLPLTGGSYDQLYRSVFLAIIKG